MAYRAMAAAAVAVSVSGVLAGCTPPSGDGRTAPEAVSVSASDGEAASGVAVPADFPPDVPLPTGRLVAVSSGAVPVGRRLWSLTYTGDDGPTAIGTAEGSALRKAGFLVTLEAADGTGSYLRDRTSVITEVQGGGLVVMVTQLSVD